MHGHLTKMQVRLNVMFTKNRITVYISEVVSSVMDKKIA